MKVLCHRIGKNRLRILFFALVILLWVLPNISWSGSFSEGDSQPFSPAFIRHSLDANHLFVLEQTANRLDLLDLESGKLLHGPEFPKSPTGMLQVDESIVVTTDNGTGEVFRIKTTNLKIQNHFTAGHGARSPVFCPSRKVLSICHTWANEVGFYSYPNGKLIKKVRVLRQPFASVLSKDQKYLFVTNFITHQRADQDTVASAVSVINMETLEVEKNLLLANGSNALRGITLSSNGDFVLISHNLGRFQVPTTKLEQGWMNTSALSVINVEKLFYEGTVLLDEPDYGAAGSWGIDCHDGIMVVAHSGTHDISIIDERKFFEKLISTKEREALSYDLNFLGEIRQRIPMPGNGPRAVDIHDSQVCVSMYFSDTINRMSINLADQKIRSYPLNEGYLETDVRLGEKYFNDAQYCFQGWQSCNGCHPLEGRVDGLNWDLLNDGIGNPKNCKSMLLAHATPPAMITGIRKNAETAVRAGFRYIQFTQVPEDYAKAVDAYLTNLHPVPSPFLSEGKLTRRAENGKLIFNEIGCATCHVPPLYTDLKMHIFVSPNDTLGEKKWDTPTLVEVWRTGPWMHDGRCAKIEEVFSKEKHGIEGELTNEELNDLVEYVLSL